MVTKWCCSDAAGATVDALVYAAGDTARDGWFGPALLPYRVVTVFAAEGQLLFRRRDEATGRPVADSDTAADWAQMTADPIAGRKVRYPGWSADRFAAPTVITATATLTVAVAPDNAYAAVVGLIDGAKSSIRLSSLTLENAGVGAALARAARRGVVVMALLEGAPPGGLSDQARYVCGLLEAGGGACWFMAGDEGRQVHSRYRYLHAKYLVIDDRIAAVSSENFSPDSLPDDDKRDGTWGRRGVVLITDARAVAAHLAAVFADDLDMAHADLRRWSAADPVYGAPPPGFVPITSSGGVTYTVRFPQPVAFFGTYRFEIGQSPENSLRAGDGLLGLFGRAGQGDTLLLEQLSERPHWGATNSNAAADPNPRLEAALSAARRGADVSLLLDSFFDDADSAVGNAATCAYVTQVAGREGLRLRCRTGNPTGLGIHNKMALAQIDGRGFVHVGSLNGTEVSHKGNRELTLQRAVGRGLRLPGAPLCRRRATDDIPAAGAVRLRRRGRPPAHQRAGLRHAGAGRGGVCRAGQPDRRAHRPDRLRPGRRRLVARLRGHAPLPARRGRAARRGGGGDVERRRLPG